MRHQPNNPRPGEITQYIRAYSAPVGARHVRTSLGKRTEGETTDEDKQLARAIKEIEAPYGGWCLVFDTETTTDIRQVPRLGFYELHGIKRSERVHLYSLGELTRERLDTLDKAGVFYNPDELSAAEIALIHNYAREHGLKCLTRDEFVDFVYKWVERFGALCIGHNLPFDLSRLATGWGRGRRDYRGGFSIGLCSDKQMRWNKSNTRRYPKYPNIRLRQVGRFKTFIKIALRASDRQVRAAESKDESSRYRKSWDAVGGRFLDTATLARALFGPGVPLSLGGLAKMLHTRGQKIETDEHGGPVTVPYLDYARNDPTVTWEIYQKLRDLYGAHHLSTPMWRIYSEASIGKAYLRDMGITPPLERFPDFPPEVLGHTMTALYGARIEMHYRLAPVEVENVDFKSQYPTGNALLGLQEILLAKELTIRRDGALLRETQELLDTVTLEQLHDPTFWRRLRVYTLIEPDHDRLPFRGDFNGQRNVALPLIEQGLPTWYALPDRIASKLLTAKAPRVLDAFEIVPSDETIPTRQLAFFGNDRYRIDPQTQDIFAEVISLRGEIQEQVKRAEGAEGAQLKGVEQGLKLLANSTSYGIFVEVDESDPYVAARAVTVHARSSWEMRTKTVESPGRYFFSPLGALIPAAGRLMLAITEMLAVREGLTYAHMDTDGITLMRDHTTWVDSNTDADCARFYAACARVREWWTPLSPYRDRPPLLDSEKQNIWPEDKTGERTPLYFVGVSSKRYALYNLIPDDAGPIEQNGKRYQIRIRKFSSHGTGTYNKLGGYQSPAHIPPPWTLGRDGEPDSWPLGGERWCYDLWYDFLVTLHTGRYSDGRALHRDKTTGEPQYHLPTSTQTGGNPWLCLPAYHQTTLGTWTLFDQYSEAYRGSDDVRPFNFFSVLPPFDKNLLRSRYTRAHQVTSDGYVNPYETVPSGVPFIGPYVDSPDEIRAAIAAGLFHASVRDAQTEISAQVTLPVGVETPTVAEVFRDHFCHPEAKSADPHGVGLLGIPTIAQVSHIVAVGKETNNAALATAEETDYLLLGEEATESGAQVYGEDCGSRDWKARLRTYRLSDLMLATGLKQQTLSDLKSGKTTKPTPVSLGKLVRGLALLDNPAELAEWRDMPSDEIALRITASYELEAQAVLERWLQTPNGRRWSRMTPEWRDKERIHPPEAAIFRDEQRWTRERVQQVRSGTRQLDEDERARFIAVVGAWQREQEIEDGDPDLPEDQEGTGEGYDDE